jgi:hypothetical protein
MQDCYEYLLLWCFPKAVKLSNGKELWIPYLRRSIKNCFVNVLQRHHTKSRFDETIFHTPITDYICETIEDLQGAIDARYEFEELVHSIKSEISNFAFRVLSDILDPPMSLNLFVTIKRVQVKSISTRKVLVEYYKTSPHQLNDAISQIKKSIAETC